MYTDVCMEMSWERFSRRLRRENLFLNTLESVLVFLAPARELHKLMKIDYDRHNT